MKLSMEVDMNTWISFRRPLPSGDIDVELPTVCVRSYVELISSFAF